MIKIHTDGITYIEPVPGATSEWYYGLSMEHGDLFEAEEVFRAGESVHGNSLCLIHFPDGKLFRPVPKQAGTCFEKPVFYEDCIFILNVSFPEEKIRIFRFDCKTCGTELHTELSLNVVRNCYNLMLHVSPLCLTRQGDDDLFEIVWPETVSFAMHPHESFFLRQGSRLFFNKWYEEGEGSSYRYWEETVIRDLSGNVIETLPGDVRLMPDGEIWHLE